MPDQELLQELREKILRNKRFLKIMEALKVDIEDVSIFRLGSPWGRIRVYETPNSVMKVNFRKAKNGRVVPNYMEIQS